MNCKQLSLWAFWKRILNEIFTLYVTHIAHLGCLLALIPNVFIFFLKVNGINLLKVHAADEFAYGRMLLDTLFT